MKRIELVSLRLRNFKGARDVRIDLDGGNAAIFGRNATGKTSTFDAFTWLLFEKDSAGRKDFDIKTISGGEQLHGVDHEVEGVFRVDGDELTLRRVYAEKYTKKRGSATAEMTGHETSHFVDGVPVSKGEYAQRVAGIADEATWRLLSDPAAFQALHWQERRKVLLEVCGDVSDEDVIASDAELADLPVILGKRTIDEHRKVVAARRAHINRELAEIPARIDEASRALPEEPNITREQVNAGLTSARVERNGVERERAALQSGGADAAGPRKRLAEVEDAMAALEREGRAAADEAQRAARLERQRLTDAVADAESAVKRLERERSSLTGDLKGAELRVERLRDEWASVHARQPDVHTPDTCPACKQALPADRVQAAHAAALAQFNERKAAELERVQASGKEQAAQVAALKASLDEVEAKLGNANDALDAAQAALGDANDAPLPEPPDPRATKPWVALDIERKQLTEQIKSLKAGEDGALDKLDAEAERLDQLIASFEADMAAHAARELGRSRIKELKGQEKSLAGEFENLERELYLLDLFTRAKVALLEQHVADKFEVVRFKLFAEQVNGGLQEVCTATVNGVPYESVNHAGQIAAGLDIIRTLQQHYGLSAPVWIDQAESITDIPSTGAQQIALIVSEADKTLRVETAAPEEIAA